MATSIPPRPDGASDSVAMIATWIRRCGFPFAILSWTGVALLLLWLAGHILQTLLLLTIAALLAYALSPVVNLLTRIMPRVLAILIVYLVILGALSAVLYLIVSTAIMQFSSLASYVQTLLTPGKQGQLTPFEQTARSLGISPIQIASARDRLVTSIEGFAGSIVPLLAGLVGALLDVILVAVLSIYFLAGGSRVFDWLRENMPTRQQGRMKLLLDTLQRVVGGYLRGQLILCAFVGLLVGIGMEVIGVPFAILLGVLAFVLEFIPVLGTLTSGVICVMLALSKGWGFAAIVLVYFVLVHVIEGDVVGPRLVGKTIGLHPIVSLAALIAGAELFGIAGALLASPIAGVLQALLIAIWEEWREAHPTQFQKTRGNAMDKPEAVAKMPDGPAFPPDLQ
jgi:predicted PurR-regulated permease PerM